MVVVGVVVVMVVAQLSESSADAAELYRKHGKSILMHFVWLDACGMC